MAYVYRAVETYNPSERMLNGLIPSVRLKDANVLVVSLGADPERCKELADKLAEFLKTIE